MTIKLNVCCGDDYREGYINIDFSDKRSDGKPIKVDLILNILNDEFPFPLCNVDEIIFHESLEHFNRHNGLFVLKKLHSIMKSGAILDLTVPPAKKQLKMFLMQMDNVKSIEDFTQAHERFSPLKFHDDLMGGTRLSDGFDGDSHKTLYSVNMIKVLLNHVGFSILSIDENIHVKAKKI